MGRFDQLQCRSLLVSFGLLAVFLACAACSTRTYRIGDNTSAGAMAGTGASGEAGAVGEGGAAGQTGCPAACTHGCSGDLCEIDPLTDGSVPRCPPGLDCLVHCEQDGSCSGLVNCGSARSCQLDCTGQNACLGGLTCGSAETCTATCTGTGACGALSCADASSCSVVCSGSYSCGAGVVCGSGACNVACEGSRACLGALDCGKACACDWSCVPGSGCAAALPPCPAGCGTTDGCTSTACNACL